MLLDPNLDIFRGIPDGFRTPFASNDSALSGKYQAVAKAAGDANGLVSIGEKLLCQQQAQAWHSGLTLVNFTKATVVGDILSQALPQVAWMSKTGPAGLVGNLDLLAKGHFDRLMTLCGVDREDLTDMVAEVRALTPKPGAGFGAGVVQSVAPDVYIRQAPDGMWVVEPNTETMPRVLMNQRYYATVSKTASARKTSNSSPIARPTPRGW